MENSNRANVSLLMHGTMLMFASSYLFVLVNPLNSIIRTIYNETYMERNGVAMSKSTWAVYLSLTSSFFIIGGLVGGLGMQFILKITSRKRLMQLAHVINILSVILIAGVGKITESYEVFIVGRFVGGICFGLSFNLPSLMVSETSIKQKQNFWQSIISVSSCCGILFAVIIGHDKILGSLTLWPVAFSIGALPSIVYLITSLHLPNTPYDVLHRLGKQEALNVLRTLRNGSKELIHQEFELLQPDIELTRKIGIIEILSIKQFRNQFLAVNILLCNIVMGGIDTILLYSSVIFINVGISKGNMIFINIGAYSLMVLSSVVCTMLVNKFGGYRVLFVGTNVLIFSQVLFTISQALTYLAPTVMPTLAVFLY
nr:solute carrier family 2, facilitated glucose transporter member 7-like [Ciona intestinalis]|eukprot:XP_026691308.1 solute carrier family 2, facilitated glucose transporter member 7-like [Ciona intestinalis]